MRVLIWALAAALLAGIAPAADLTPPTITIVSPLRGEFVRESRIILRGMARDDASRIASVEVNGQPANLDANNAWAVPVSLEFGANLLTAKATDSSGNSAFVSWSVLYAPEYLPADAVVENGLAIRLGGRALNAIEDGIARGINIESVHVIKTAAELIALPAPSIELDFQKLTSTNPEYSATTATFTAALAIEVRQGSVVARLSEPSVSLTGFKSVHILEAVATDIIRNLILGAASGPIEDAVNSFFEGKGLDVKFAPQSVATGNDELRIYLNAGVVLPPAPPNPPPGSPSRGGTRSEPPRYEQPADLSISLREDSLNRLYYAAWLSGANNLRIDQAFLAEQGFTLPFSLDAQFLVPFVPALEPFVTGGHPAPIAIVLDAKLPPVAEVVGAPSLLTTGIGELQITIQLDMPRPIDVLSFVMHIEREAAVKVAGDRVRIVPGNPTLVSSSLLSNPLGLSQSDIDQFLQSGIPFAIATATTVLPPFPLPSALPSLPSPHATVFRDGATGDYLTIESERRRQ